MKAQFVASICGAIVVAALAVSWASPASAQIGEATRQSNEIMREQQLRRNEDRLRGQSHRPPAQLEMPAPKTPQGSGDGCWNIDNIVITGADHMPARQQRKIIKKYSGNCLGVDAVQALLSDITRFYIDKGYSTTRAYLPQQDLSTKTLTIDVIEGKVGELKLQEGDKGSMYLDGAFPNVTGKVMNLRDFEQGLDQLNRLPSNSATIDIAPGETAGDSIVTIRNEISKRWHGSATADTYGSRSTGKHQASGTFSYDNLLGNNDLLSVTYRRSQAIFDDPNRYSDSVNGFASVPYGYTLFTAGASWSAYESELVTAGPVLALDGTSKSGFFGADHTLWRTQTDKLTLSSTLTVKKQENRIAGNKLVVSSRPLTVLDIGTNYSTTLLGGSCSLGVTYSRGLTAFGAYNDPSGLANDIARAQFNKLGMNASWYKPFTVGAHNLSWSTAITAQRAFDTLYGTEQISIGGLYTVRGFYEESVASDTGIYARNDLSMQKRVGTFRGLDLMAKPYLSLDAGDVSSFSTGGSHGSIVGGGAGVTFSAGSASFEIFTGRPIVTSNNMRRHGFHSFSRLNISF